MTMRVLQLCHKPPLPAVDGGCLAMHSVTEGLLNACIRVRVLTAETHKHPFREELLPPGYKTATSVEAVFLDTRVKFTDALLNYFSDKSYNLARFYSDAFDRKLRQVLAEFPVEIVQLESLFMTPYIPTIRACSGAKIVLRAHNVESLLWERRTNEERNFGKKEWFRLLTKRLRKAETDVLSQVDALVPITQEDLVIFEKMAGRPLRAHVLPYAIQLPDVQAGRLPEPFSVFHIGAMDWSPNISGVKWFLENCWPQIRPEAPAATLHLAGKNLMPGDPQYSGGRVTVHGEVPDAHEFMRDYGLMIVPLASGGGMRVKLVEAMALGKTIVATSLGAEGTGLVHEQQALIADTPQDFSRAVIRLLKDPELAQRLAANARRHAENEFEISNATRKLIEFYRSLPA